MSFHTQSASKRLKIAFQEEGLELSREEKFYLADGKLPLEKVHEVAERAKCELIFRPEQLDGKWAFAVRKDHTPATFEISNHFFGYYRESNVDTAEFKQNKRFLSEDHYENNRRQIEQLLDKQGDSIKSVVILGPGNCDDIPLESIARHCTHVALMEIDRTTLYETIGKLPAELQKKIKPIVCDLTGVMEYFRSQVISMTQDISAEDGYTLYDKILNKSSENSKPLPLPRHYDLVISSMMLNQLFLQSLLWVKYAMITKVAVQDQPQFSATITRASSIAFNDWVTLQHFKHMENLANQDAIIYFSDQMYTLPTVQQDDTLVPVMRCQLQSMWVLTEQFLTQTPVICKTRWLWDTKLPHKDPETGEVELGSRMEVYSYAYKPW